MAKEFECACILVLCSIQLELRFMLVDNLVEIDIN